MSDPTQARLLADGAGRPGWRRARVVLTLCSGLLISTALLGVEPNHRAPFGLDWLSPVRGLTHMGIDPGKMFATQFGDSYIVSHLPKSFTDQHYAVLSFGYNNRLVRITTIGVGFENDHDGGRIKARCQQLQDLLEQKYGAGASESHTDKNFTGDRFGIGLRTGENWMFTEFRGHDVHVELSMFAEGTKARWRMIFEYVPGMQQLERQRREIEEQAL